MRFLKICWSPSPALSEPPSFARSVSFTTLLMQASNQVRRLRRTTRLLRPAGSCPFLSSAIRLWRKRLCQRRGRCRRPALSRSANHRLGDRWNAAPRSSTEAHASRQTSSATPPRWIIEGCYGALIRATARHCDQLVFLTPGREVCLAHTQNRPWKPHVRVHSSARQHPRSAADVGCRALPAR